MDEGWLIEGTLGAMVGAFLGGMIFGAVNARYHGPAAYQRGVEAGRNSIIEMQRAQESPLLKLTTQPSIYQEQRSMQNIGGK